MHLVLRSFLCALIAVLITCTALAQASAQKAEYTLGSGDKLRVTVFGHEDLSGEFLVEGTGLVSLPLIGGVPLGGKTISEAEEAIIDALRPDYLINPRVSLQVLNYRPFYIIGEVNSPGSYPYVSGMTVLEAVAIAGGFTYRAKEKEMTIVRGTDTSRQKEEATPETFVRPGDVIEVPERFF